jgi:hypothetical protein
MLRPNRRPELVVGGARVPREELACYKVGDDGDVTAAQPSRAVSRPLSGPAARADRKLVCLHGAGNRSPMCRGEGVCVSKSCHMAWTTP